MITASKYFFVPIFAFIMGIGINHAFAQSYWWHTSMPDNDAFHTFSIKAFDSLDYVLAAGGVFGSSGTVYRTEDGGKNWKNLFSGDGFVFRDVVHPAKNLIVVAADSDFSYTKTSGNQVFKTYRFGGIIYRSSDGGSNWQTQLLGTRDTSTPANFIGSISALDSNHLFLAGDSLRVSSDGGLSWQTVHSPVSVTYNAMALSITNPIGAYTAANTLVLAEADTYSNRNYGYKIFRSTDLGQTWSQGFQTLHNISDLAFVNQNIGFAAASTIDQSFETTAFIDKTTDGGLSWFTIYFNKFPSATPILSIAFADSLNGLAGGEDGLLLRTTNGGVSWSEENTDFSKDDIAIATLNAIGFPSINSAIVGYSGPGALVYTPNGLLGMPKITYPDTSLTFPCTFTARWDSVQGATQYAVELIVPGPNTIILDTLINTNSISLIGINTTQSLHSYSLSVQAISADNKSNTARLAFYVSPCSSFVSNDNNLGSPKEYLWVQSYPNPADNNLRIRLNGLYSDHHGALTAEMDDLLGRKVMDLTSEAIKGSNGSYSDFLVDGSKVPAGTYIVRYTFDSYSAMGQVVIIH